MTKADETGAIGALFFDRGPEVLRNASGSDVPLRPQTARVLAILVAKRGEVVSKETLMREVWVDTHVTDDSLVQCISEIRKALGPEAAGKIRTVPKRGYLLEEPSPQMPQTRKGHPRGWRIAGLGLLAILLLASLLFQVTWRAPATIAPKDTVIAILPFENVSNDPAQDYFAIGLAEDLLTDLSRMGTVTVLSRESTFAYGEGGDGEPGVPAVFGATHLVDGSVRREGDQVRINVRLVETDSRSSVWAERYDRRVGEIFEVQDDVRAQIVRALSLQLVPDDVAGSRSGSTDVVLAYDLLLRGRHWEAALGRSGVTKAIEFYEQAIAVDPTYGAAFARLANMYDFSARLGWSAAPERDAMLAVEYAEKAIALGPRNPFAHWTYGRILSRRGDGSPDIRGRAFEALRRAIELDPNYADAYAFMALLHIGKGSPVEAQAAIDRALQLNPQAPYWYLQNSAIIAYMQNEFDDAVVLLEQAAEQSPTTPFTRIWLAAAYARTGRLEDASWEVEEAILLGSPATVDGVLAGNPIFSDRSYLEAYRTGLREAGFSE